MKTRMKFTTEVAWGGSDDNETLNDVLNRIKRVAPSTKYRRLDIVAAHWPVYEFEVDAMELAFIADEFDSTVEDFDATPV